MAYGVQAMVSSIPVDKLSDIISLQVNGKDITLPADLEGLGKWNELSKNVLYNITVAAENSSSNNYYNHYSQYNGRFYGNFS